LENGVAANTKNVAVFFNFPIFIAKLMLANLAYCPKKIKKPHAMVNKTQGLERR